MKFCKKVKKKKEDVILFATSPVDERKALEGLLMLFGLYCFTVVFGQSVENKIDNNTYHKCAWL